MSEVAQAPTRDPVRTWRALAWVPAILILLPVALSIGAWLLPTNAAGLTGFVERADISLLGIALVGSWLACAVLIASLAFASGRRQGPFRSLDFVEVRGFHIAVCVIGAIGTGWIYWTVTGGSLSTLVSLWTNQEFTRFRSEFDYGIGVSTGRYASVLAGGLSLARLFTGRRIRALDWASFAVLTATVLLNSRISAFMALAAAAAIICFASSGRVRVVRVSIAALALVTLFVFANYSRSAEFYEAAGVRSPLAMAAQNAHSYLATPTQVTAAASSAAMNGSALPTTSVAGALGPVLPPYFTKLLGAGDPNAGISNVESRYQGTVDLSLSLTTNGTVVDTLFIYGWWALLSALGVIGVAIWLAGRFIGSGEIGAAVGGVLLYGLSETWRVFIFNAGSVHFVVLLGLAAVALGSYRLHHLLWGSAPYTIPSQLLGTQPTRRGT